MSFHFHPSITLTYSISAQIRIQKGGREGKEGVLKIGSGNLQHPSMQHDAGCCYQILKSVFFHCWIKKTTGQDFQEDAPLQHEHSQMSH